MHSFAHHHDSESGEASAKETHGLIHNGGWPYPEPPALVRVSLRAR